MTSRPSSAPRSSSNPARYSIRREPTVQEPQYDLLSFQDEIEPSARQRESHGRRILEVGESMSAAQEVPAVQRRDSTKKRLRAMLQPNRNTRGKQPAAEPAIRSLERQASYIEANRPTGDKRLIRQASRDGLREESVLYERLSGKLERDVRAALAQAEDARDHRGIDHGVPAHQPHRDHTQHVRFDAAEQHGGSGNGGGWLVRNSHFRPQVSGLDLNNTTESEVVESTTYKAVTHTSFQPVIHHVRQELISRDVHRPEVFRRILPIREVIVRPSKHFVVSPHDGTLVEVDRPPSYTRSSVHGGSQWSAAEPQLLAQAQKQEPPPLHVSGNGETISEHEPDGAPDGIKRQRTFHYYPSTVDEAARLRGLTQPVEIPATPEREEDRFGDIPHTRKSAAVSILRKPSAEDRRIQEKRARFSIRPPEQHVPGEFPDANAPMDKTVDVTPWEFSRDSSQKDEREDPVERGGHSIASEKGRQLLHQRRSSRSAGSN